MEFPDENLDPDGILSELVKTHMIHGPCGHIDPECVCMKDKNDGRERKCKAGYPKQFQEETSIQEDGYPLYRRRNGQGPRRQWTKKVRGTDISMDNRWVVPYSPYLLYKYQAHINVEVCTSVKAIEYINKYIFIGNDRMTVQLQNENDEVARHLNGHYIGPTQAAWNLFEYQNHLEDPSVVT